MITTVFFIHLLTISLCSATSSVDAGPGLQCTDVFVAGADGYHTYRIPALLATQEGTLLAFCEGRKGSRSDSGDIDLLVKRSADGGRTWSTQQAVWDDGANTCGNPCPVVDQTTGTIWLPMTWNHGKDSEDRIKQNAGKDTRRVFITYSDDDGQTWAKPREITTDVKRPEWRWYATGPGVGIQLTQGPWKGRLLIPCDHTLVLPDDPDGYCSHVIFSDDHGQTWRLGGAIRPAVNECQVVELSDGTLMMNMRNYDRSQTSRAIAASTDGGMNWSEIRHDPTLVEPICQASLVQHAKQTPDGRVCLLFSNPAHAESGKRLDMTVRMSEDRGTTWPVSRLLWPGPAAYSCLCAMPDGGVTCLFEAGRTHPYERIVLARFSRDWLVSKDGVP
ncbi:MAG: sialidase family protein [Phycisphaerales bacterium]